MFDRLSRETYAATYAKHSVGSEQQRFDLRSLSPALRNLWLLLVYLSIYSGFVQGMENLVSHEIEEFHFSGLESHQNLELC